MGSEFWINKISLFDENVGKKEREYCERIGKDKNNWRGHFIYVTKMTMTMTMIIDDDGDNDDDNDNMMVVMTMPMMVTHSYRWLG